MRSEDTRLIQLARPICGRACVASELTSIVYQRYISQLQTWRGDIPLGYRNGKEISPALGPLNKRLIKLKFKIYTGAIIFVNAPVIYQARPAIFLLLVTRGREIKNMPNLTHGGTNLRAGYTGRVASKKRPHLHALHPTSTTLKLAGDPSPHIVRVIKTCATRIGRAEHQK